ncbi:MAG TPA: TfoX/Sxy family protein [Acidimicrobiales bacterium]|nr:TfoX/Sxy family protein [Acidimicrobiales bacterium]
MAYDEQLADRIRELIAQELGISEQRMFGGLAFLVSGNMAIAASGQGGLLVRADPEESQKWVATGGAEVVVMQGSPDAGLAACPRGPGGHQAGPGQVGGPERRLCPLVATQDHR